ncbi:ABC transporter substrate-binding protein [Leptolyngbya sp. FACHB-17]|uniref:ABC transporter substrate-binding protein n=1 Tax=unclassified Leptolyngbya TaxID=2650499 RepID=UPI00168156F0|nr:ABC transporter substrate-binding protein [Leptolyngbya sp. FACHB-17]MBD2081646.1 ABC transporter substrate-binding protein [Leptolyngbya sp. FACHB-17]
MSLRFAHLLKFVFTIAICLSLFGCQPAQSSNVIRLTLWQGVNPPPNRDVLQKLVDRFNQAHPNIQVESLYVGQGDQQMPKILAAVVGNAPPDMLWYAPMITGQLVELDALRSIDDFLATSSVKSELDPALLNTMQYEGKTWSIPFGTNNVGIYYRPSLFEAAGVKKLPRTWTEFRQVAKQLTRDTDGDGKADQHGMLLPLGKGEWTVFTWLPFMFSGAGELGSATVTYGNEITPEKVIPSSASAGVNIANSGAIAALQFWRDLMQDGSAILSQPERGYELNGFLAGKVAMQLSGPWTLGQLQATQVDFGVLPIPKGTQAGTAIGGENLFLFKSTPERERAAFEFAEFVMSEEFQTEWAIGTGYLPTNLKSRESEAYKAFRATQPAVDVFLGQAQFGRSRPIFPGYNRISDNLGRAIEAALLDRNTPEEALKAAQQRLDLIFK